MISFSPGRKGLAKLHLQTDQVGKPHGPLPQLLTDHLMQGVWHCCVYPGFIYGAQIDLDSLTEDMEKVSFEDDGPQEGGPVHKTASLTAIVQRSDHGSGGGLNKVTRAYAQIHQFSVEEMECGEGKVAFEGYLHTALSTRNVPLTP